MQLDVQDGVKKIKYFILVRIKAQVQKKMALLHTIEVLIINNIGHPQGSCFSKSQDRIKDILWKIPMRSSITTGIFCIFMLALTT